MCFQEVNLWQFDCLRKELGEWGYSGELAEFGKKDTFGHGLAIFYRNNKFELVRAKRYDLGSLIKKKCSNNEKHVTSDLLRHPQVFQAIALRFKGTESSYLVVGTFIRTLILEALFRKFLNGVHTYLYIWSLWKIMLQQVQQCNIFIKVCTARCKTADRPFDAISFCHTIPSDKPNSLQPSPPPPPHLKTKPDCFVVAIWNKTARESFRNSLFADARRYLCFIVYFSIYLHTGAWSRPLSFLLYFTGNIHVLWGNLLQTVTSSVQVAMATQALHSFIASIKTEVNSGSFRHIFSGDFNSEPSFPVYHLLSEGKLTEKQWSKLRTVDYIRWPSAVAKPPHEVSPCFTAARNLYFC